MLKTKYFKFARKSIFSYLLGVMSWSAMTTFMIASKKSIGVENIPMFEFIYSVVGVLAVWLVFNKRLKNLDSSKLYRRFLLLDITKESIFLIALYSSLLINGSELSLAGVIIYIVIYTSSIIKTGIEEYARIYEHSNFTKKRCVDAFSTIRGLSQKAAVAGGLAGSSISMLALTYAKLDLLEFTLAILVLNIISNIYDFILYIKYIRYTKDGKA